jgi:hypothetical protein
MVLRTVSCVDGTDLQSFVFCGIVTQPDGLGWDVAAPLVRGHETRNS